ncbi:MAG: hypothetical protein SVU32_08880 [Candidatus Nanohaloarchaea archaeon]|nr:hypothetical protein [Candidatus Nanohaloarchaea archaeon]
MMPYQGDRTKQTKAQQVQFFRDCLLPNYEVPWDYIDLRADVDSTLTTMENWQQLQEQYSIETRSDEDLLEEYEQYEEMADRYYRQRPSRF